MPDSCNRKVVKFVREQDLFSVPVQLTYQGEVAHNTCLGGCLSLCVIVGIVIGSTFALLDLVNTPQFYSYAPQFTYGDPKVTISTEYNTLAVGVYAYKGNGGSEWAGIKGTEQLMRI